MYSDILSLVRTNHDRDTLISELGLVHDGIFETNGGVEKALRSAVRVSVAGLIRNHLAAGEPVDTLIDGLKQSLVALEEVNITLAFEPTEEVVDIIYNWVSAELGHGVVLVFDINSTILAGARIAYKGKYYDGGLAQVVENALHQDMTEVIKMISSASK